MGVPLRIYTEAMALWIKLLHTVYVDTGESDRTCQKNMHTPLWAEK